LSVNSNRLLSKKPHRGVLPNSSSFRQSELTQGNTQINRGDRVCLRYIVETKNLFQKFKVMSQASNYPNRRFVIFPVSELPLIDFSQVFETSADTVRRSVDGVQTFVKYDVPMPSSVSALPTKSQEYTYDEIVQILSGPLWTDPEPIE
jgi:hypothetical protein